MESIASSQETHREFPCSNCGAKLVFAPGTDCLECPHCGTSNRIAVDDAPIIETDYTRVLAEAAAGEQTQETLTVKCSSCGAETQLPPNVTAKSCAFCGAAIVAEAASRKLIRPQYLLPFHVTAQQALSSFRNWIASRWFAPSCLNRNAEAGRLSGVYLPAWTYDCGTDSQYTGMRGDDYWVTEHYMATETYTENGRTRTRTVPRTRQVRKTRWTPVSGRVQVSFDDMLVRASEALPEDYFHKLEPWDLKNLVEYRDDYLAGFTCESYQVDLAAGFTHAQHDMQSPIHSAICGDIGGDHQQVHHVDTRYFDITFKHILLPLWLSAYDYHGKTFRFMVNARTGEVHGERPYSFWKIGSAVVAATAVIVAIVLIAQMR